MRIGIHLVLLFFVSSTLFAQYTDQINSNRPGESIGAFSVGTGVIQFEAGLSVAFAERSEMEDISDLYLGVYAESGS